MRLEQRMQEGKIREECDGQRNGGPLQDFGTLCVSPKGNAKAIRSVSFCFV